MAGEFRRISGQVRAHGPGLAGKTSCILCSVGHFGEARLPVQHASKMHHRPETTLFFAASQLWELEGLLGILQSINIRGLSSLLACQGMPPHIGLCAGEHLLNSRREA